jgi:hypothetical protein
MKHKNLKMLTTALFVALTCSVSGQATIEGSGQFVTATPGGTVTVTYELTAPETSNTLIVGVYNDNVTTPASISFDGNASDSFVENNRTLAACHFNPDASVDITVNVDTAGAATGIFVYELSGIDTAIAPVTGTGSMITTTEDSMFVLNFTGINFGTGAGTQPTTGSLVPIAQSEVLDINGGIGGGALAYGFGTAGFAGTQTLGWSYSNGANNGEVSLGLATGANPDTDSDGLLDVWEMANFGDLDELGTDDPDGDGANNEAEETAGSNPNDINSIPGDVDGDDFLDANELLYFGNLAQGPEDDFDGDFTSNVDEANAGTDPSNASSWPDTDSDFMADGWETANGLNVGVDDSLEDADNDLALNIDEFEAGSDPQDANWTPGNAVLAHRWSFNGDLTDSVGGSDAIIANDDALELGLSSDLATGTGIELFGGAKANSDYVLLGSNLLSDIQSGGVKPVTIELWATQEVVQNWSRIFNFGTDDGSNPGNNESLRMTWSQGTDINADQVAWEPAVAFGPGNAPYAEGVPYHIVMTIVPAVFSNGALASGAEVTWYSAPAGNAQSEGHPLYGAKGSLNSVSDLRDLLDSAGTLGRSYYPDDTAAATYDEVRIWRGALTETERELFQLIGPNAIDRSDADSDGFPDAWEIARFGNTTTAAIGADTDGDLDDDDFEFEDESNPNDVLSTIFDADKDNLDDAWEMSFFNNLLQTGSDDFDGDFTTNEVEETEGTDPTDPDDSPDLDGDGIADGWEIFWFGDTVTADETTDFDGDLLTISGTEYNSDFDEFQKGTDPTDRFSGVDTDADLLPDYWEFFFFESNFGNPGYLVFNGSNDFDNDGADHAAEFADRTDPTDENDFGDANGDGIFDGVALSATDGFGQSSFNAGTNWSDGAAPVAGNNYLVPSGLRLRTPDIATDTIFEGDNLVIAGELALKGDGTAFTADYVFSDELSVPRISQIVNAGGTVFLDGSVSFQTDSEIDTQNGPVSFLADVSGSGGLNLLGPGDVIFENVSNTYSGDVTMSSTASLVVNGDLTTGAGSVFNIAPLEADVTNAIVGFGTINLAGTFDIDLSGTTPSNGASWLLIGPLPTYDPSFTVIGSGFTPDGSVVGDRIWTDSSGNYEFDEFTGVLSFTGFIAGFGGWTTDNELTGGVDDGVNDNPDSDSFDNLLEYQLGGDPLLADNLIDSSFDANSLTLTFERFDTSETDSTLTFRWSTDLENWNDVIVGAASSGPDANGVVVTITEDGGASGADYDAVIVELPTTNAVGGKLFGHLVGTLNE